jgi:tetratricopeptide (TPR) repeat protein
MDWTYIYAKGIPIESQYLYRKALDLSKLGKYETALRYFKQAVVIAPLYSTAFYEMGNCLTKLEQYDDAIMYYNRAIDIDPLNADAQIKRNIAINYRELNDADRKFFEMSTALPSR